MSEAIHVAHLGITLQPLDGSSNITHEAYDPVAQAFYVKFTSGPMIYRYAGDPADPDSAFTQELYDAFKASPSKGKFFHQRIKSWFAFGKHQQEIEEEKP